MRFPQAIELKQGMTMVTTDLHGHGKIYDRLRAIFLEGYHKGQIHHWVIAGDLLHHKDETQDESLRMILDVMQLRDELGHDVVILLCGNHEMPHIYGQPLWSNDKPVTYAFENALANLDQQPKPPRTAQQVRDFLMTLPFYAITNAGVMIAHAGPSKLVQTPREALKVLNMNHKAFLADVDAELHQYDLDHAAKLYAKKRGRRAYQKLVKEALGVSSKKDPRYYHLLRSFVLEGRQEFVLLWDVLFNQNELEFPNDLRRVTVYGQIVQRFLKAMSHHVTDMPQHMLVSGHIGTNGGHAVIDDYHLRLSTYVHAKPESSGQYLLFDSAQYIADADALVSFLHSVMD